MSLCEALGIKNDKEHKMRKWKDKDGGLRLCYSLDLCWKFEKMLAEVGKKTNEQWKSSQSIVL